MALPAMQSISTATVRILGGTGERAGQGLAVPLPDGRLLILTCYHVVAVCPDPRRIAIDVFDAFDRPRLKLLAAYSAERSDPSKDLAVLLPLETFAVDPVSLARLGDTFHGLQPVTGVTRPFNESHRFNATLADPTRLELEDKLFRGAIPLAYRLTLATDVRPGISGSPVAGGGAVLGLTHFSRAEEVNVMREGYLVPVKAWFRRNPELQALSRPFVDPLLASKAVVKAGPDLDPAADLDLYEYRDGRVFERPEEGQAERILKRYNRCLIRGRPGSGKTWLAYRLAHGSSGMVVIPRASHPPAEFDKSALFEDGLLLLIDGAEGLESSFSFLDWNRALSGSREPGLLVTARDGPDWRTIESRFRKLAEVFSGAGAKHQVFTSATPEGGRDIEPEAAKAFVAKAGLPPAAYLRFDGTIGSLIAPADAMKARYRDLQETATHDTNGSLLLDSLKVLRLLHVPLREGVARRIAAKTLGHEPSEALWRDLERLTGQAGFGHFDEQGLFRGYKAYLDQCVTYVPDMDDFQRFAEALESEGDRAPLVNAGLKLLYYGDERGLEFLRAALERGDRDALKVALVTMAASPSHVPAAIRVAHKLVREGEREFLAVLAALYERRGKRRGGHSRLPGCHRGWRRGCQSAAWRTVDRRSGNPRGRQGPAAPACRAASGRNDGDSAGGSPDR